MEHLKEVVAAGRANLSMYDELSKYGASMKKRILSFVNNALIYSGNQEKVFKWCENLETHLFNHKW